MATSKAVHFFPQKLFSGTCAKAKLGKGKLCVSRQKAVSGCPGLKLTLTEPTTMKIYLSSQVKRKCQKKIQRLQTLIENNWRFNMDKCVWEKKESQRSLHTQQNHTQEFYTFILSIALDHQAMVKIDCFQGLWLNKFLLSCVRLEKKTQHKMALCYFAAPHTKTLTGTKKFHHKAYQEGVKV